MKEANLKFPLKCPAKVIGAALMLSLMILSLLFPPVVESARPTFRALGNSEIGRTLRLVVVRSRIPARAPYFRRTRTMYAMTTRGCIKSEHEIPISYKWWLPELGALFTGLVVLGLWAVYKPMR